MNAAIVLAAGQGKRMNSAVQKQFLLLNGRPLLLYSLEAFQKSKIDRIILVTGKEEIEYCREEITVPYGITKADAIVAGGRERYHSVYEGLKAAEGCEEILIHDGARPLVTEKMIHDALDGARKYGACIVGMPVKDTIKVSDQEGFVA